MASSHSSTVLTLNSGVDGSSLLRYKGHRVSNWCWASSGWSCVHNSSNSVRNSETLNFKQTWFHAGPIVHWSGVICLFYWNVNVNIMMFYLYIFTKEMTKVCVYSLVEVVHFQLSSTHPAELLASSRRLAGFLMSLSRIETICPNFGLSLRPFSQQSNMSWCSTTGQSIGAGRR